MTDLTDAYHTALKGGVNLDDYPALERADFPVGVALRWDVIHEPMPAEFSSCDVWYGEPPWKAGHEHFTARAGAKQQTWGELNARIGWMIRMADIPIVMTAGKAALKQLPDPDNVYDTDLNGNAALLVCWGTKLWNYGTAQDAIHDLADRFDCIGDMFAGYGRTASIATHYGKRWVMSDYNARCVGVMAERFGAVRTVPAA